MYMYIYICISVCILYILFVLWSICSIRSHVVVHQMFPSIASKINDVLFGLGGDQGSSVLCKSKICLDGQILTAVDVNVVNTVLQAFPRAPGFLSVSSLINISGFTILLTSLYNKISD